MFNLETSRNNKERKLSILNFRHFYLKIEKFPSPPFHKTKKTMQSILFIGAYNSLLYTNPNHLNWISIIFFSIGAILTFSFLLLLAFSLVVFNSKIRWVTHVRYIAKFYVDFRRPNITLLYIGLGLVMIPNLQFFLNLGISALATSQNVTVLP